jgi:hypothetical protein
MKSFLQLGFSSNLVHQEGLDVDKARAASYPPKTVVVVINWCHLHVTLWGLKSNYKIMNKVLPVMSPSN